MNVTRRFKALSLLSHINTVRTSSVWLTLHMRVSWNVKTKPHSY